MNLNYNGIFSLLIASVEIVLLFNSLLVGGKSKPNKIALSIILLLFLYQLSEFLICYKGTKAHIAVYSALTIITVLPPLGLYFVAEYYKLKSKYLKLIFLPAVFFTAYFLLTMGRLEVLKCTPVYASYYYPAEFLYGIFYYLPIWAVMIILPIQYKKTKNNPTKKKLTLVLIIGWYLTFLPTFIILYLSDVYKSAVESILCKQAFILALTLSYFVMTNKEKKKKSERENLKHLLNN